MTGNLAWQFREWLTLDEAAEALSDSVGQSFTVADILRLALDGVLNLSVNLPGSTAACYEPSKEEGPKRRAHIQGVWDLPMVDPGRRQIEHEYHRIRGLPYISMEDWPGAFVQRDDLICQVPPDPGAGGFTPRGPSALPRDAVVVVRTAVLKEARETLLKIRLDAQREAWGYSVGKPTSQDSAVPITVSSEVQDNVVEKPLATRERATLLTIIAALAKEARIDVSKASKAGVTISNLISSMGHDVAPNTVARHLRNLAQLFPELKGDESG